MGHDSHASRPALSHIHATGSASGRWLVGPRAGRGRRRGERSMFTLQAARSTVSAHRRHHPHLKAEGRRQQRDELAAANQSLPMSRRRFAPATSATTATRPRERPRRR
ncbi:hypothetical protein ACPA9J_00130 [Pseudomonas aeruginosa]